MPDRKTSWLSTPSISSGWAAMISFCWVAGVVALQGSSIGLYLDEQISQTVDFRVREFLGKSPKVSNKLKILVLDDAAFADLSTWVLSIDQWALLLRALDAANPKNIIIDKLWSKVVDPNHKLEESLRIIKSLKTPITAAASASKSRIRSRHPLELDTDDFSLAKRIISRETLGAAPQTLPRLANYSGYTFFGPTRDVAPAISHVGHIIYSGTGRIYPVVQADFNTIIPHAFLFAADSWGFEGGNLVANSSQLFVDRKGQIPINFFPHRSSLYKSKTIMSLRYFLSRARHGLPTKMIEEGDTVVILPHFYTGNTDFKWTPFGYMPAGFVPAALINSVLTGQWIKPFAYPYLLSAVLVVSGVLLGMFATPGIFWLGAVVVSIGILFLAVVAFSFMNLQFSWLLPVVGFLGAALVVFSKKSRVSDRRTRALKNALEGAIRADELAGLLKNPAHITLDPRERIVTLVFVDIVGFSLVAENMIPRRAFDVLKEILDRIADIVHEHGGIIDKTLGDGLLCYFGYSFEGDKSVPGHAEAAVQAAIAIQRQSVMQTLKSSEQGLPLLPLRIGINTSSAFLGNLGSRDRIEFTVIGNGVNFAKRLEAACVVNHLMISANTKELITNIENSEPSMARKEIKIKHHQNLVEAFDYNPFILEQELEERAIAVFRRFRDAGRGGDRVKGQESRPICFECEYGAGVVSNFAVHGASLALPKLLANKELFTMNLVFDDSQFADEIRRAGIDDIRCEVRWAYRDGAVYEHGILYRNLSIRQQEALFSLLGKYLGHGKSDF